MTQGFVAAAALALAPAALADDYNKNAKSQQEQSAQAAERNPADPAAATSNNTEPARQEPMAGDDVRASRSQKDQTATSRPPDGSATATTSSGTSASDAGRTTTGAGEKKDDDKKASRHDNSDLIQKLHASNVMEVEAAKLAQDKATNDNVKNFAKQLEKDHGSMVEKLEELAKNRDFKLDKDAALAPHKAHMEEMKNMKGADFDRHYAQMMVSTHEKSLNDVKMGLERARSSGDNELAQLLETAQSKITQHHHLAMDLDKGKASPGQQRQGRRAGGSDSPSQQQSSPGDQSSKPRY